MRLSPLFSHTTTCEKPANLTALQRELADLAIRSNAKSRRPQDHTRNVEPSKLVIRGK